MNHLKNVLVTAVGIVVVALPAIWADPAMRNFVANHPGLAAYVPLVGGIVTALYRAWEKRG